MQVVQIETLRVKWTPDFKDLIGDKERKKHDNNFNVDYLLK